MNETMTLDYQTISAFLSDYEAGIYAGMRMGEAFVNEFLGEVDVITKSLHETVDEKAARKMIWGFCS